MKSPFLSVCLLLNVVAFGQTAGTEQPLVKVRMEHMVGSQPLKLNTSVYVNAHADTFTVSMYKYYLSAFTFMSANGTEVSEPEGFHLVNESKRKTKEFDIEHIPSGTYSGISFTIGVDSIYNVTGAQGGDLDPINAMFWDWNTGYIMAKLEGNSPKAPDGSFVYHIGGYAGKYSALRRVNIRFNEPLQVRAGKTAVITLSSDVAEWFKSPTVLDIATMPGIMTEGVESAMIADNYADMFSLQSVEYR